VELILDLAEYEEERDLKQFVLLEPACGHGVFVKHAVRRLLSSSKKIRPDQLESAIVAFDVNEENIGVASEVILKELCSRQIDLATARKLTKKWFRHGDFLLEGYKQSFDFIVGNPPYIRIEQLPDLLQSEYRRRYSTLYDRADLYVAFIEKSLKLLSPNGILSFICADRWILNKYGKALRELVSDKFKLRTYIDLHKASPFESEVMAYPSIFCISNGRTEDVCVGQLQTGSVAECEELRTQLKGYNKNSVVKFTVYKNWFKGPEPWILNTPRHLRVLRDLEKRFRSIEEDEATKVGIGVATGNDKIFIVDKGIDIEEDRLIPLVMRDDLDKGFVRNGGRCVINTFNESGVIDLNEYPRLKRYLGEHEEAIRSRHVARNNKQHWFRTIDRVYPEYVNQPKLLIPDIGGFNQVVFEKGEFYPHHNLYYITSTLWDLEVLGGLLSSNVALFFVWSYAVKMRGGYLRFQAQYLRRIRVPSPSTIPAKLQADIKMAFRKRDFQSLDRVALEAYGIKALPEFDFKERRE
jgi:hypothetical protein